MKKLGRKIHSLRRSLGLTQAEFGRKLDPEDPIPQTTIAKWENNLQQPRPDKVTKLAELAGTTARAFLGLDEIATSDLPGRRVPVSASLQAGNWRESVEWPEDDRYEVPAVLPNKWDNVPIYAAEVEGDSMNLFYPHGSIVFIAPLEHIPGGLKSGMHVMVVQRDHDVYESTLKEYRVDEMGKKWLLPRSSSLEHQQPVPYAKRGGDVQIRGVVVSSFAIAPGMDNIH